MRPLDSGRPLNIHLREIISLGKGEISMRSKSSWLSNFTSTLLGFALLVPVFADAQQLPRSVTVGSNPPGSVFYALASGLAKVVSGAPPIQVVVQTYTGTTAF